MITARWAGSTLRAKLLASYLLIIGLGVATTFLITELVAPSFFAIHMAQMMGSTGTTDPGGMMGAGQSASESLRTAYMTSVTQAVLVAAAVSSLFAVVASLFISGRIAGPLRRVVAATRRIAAGNYAERVGIAANRGGGGGGDEERRDEIGQLAHSFNEMASSLEATERRRVDLLGDVAHELRTPISTLEGYLEGLLDGLVEPSQETWARLHSEASRLHRLVDDLQELSRAEARQLSLKQEVVDPKQIAEVALHRMERPVEERGLSLRAKLPAGLPPVLADRDRVVQVLNNLLTNALRYTPPPGEVTLSIERVPGAGAGGMGDQLLFRVADTGVGIAPEHLPHLFERFFRVDKSRSRAAGGSGIGLTISKALVEAMGGRIWAESAGVGNGSAFSFTLPVARGMSEAGVALYHV
ncbi:MAG: ATP-binding protein [Chloroflexota bacterium]